MSMLYMTLHKPQFSARVNPGQTPIVDGIQTSEDCEDVDLYYANGVA